MTRILTIAKVVWLDVLRRKNVYVVFIIMLSLLVMLMTLNIFGLGGITGYVKEAGLLLAWVLALILAIGVSARLLPEEETRGTIFSLLARPVTRGEVVVGKWLGSWSVTCAAVTVFYITLNGIVVMRGSGFCPLIMTQGLLLHFLFLSILTALGTAFSTRLNYDAAATMTYTVTLAAMILLPRIPYLTTTVSGSQRTGLLILYYALPHFGLFDLRTRMVHDWPPIAAHTFLMIVAYGIIITAIFLLLGTMGYRSKRFSRGEIQ